MEKKKRNRREKRAGEQSRGGQKEQEDKVQVFILTKSGKEGVRMGSWCVWCVWIVGLFHCKIRQLEVSALELPCTEGAKSTAVATSFLSLSFLDLLRCSSARAPECYGGVAQAMLMENRGARGGLRK